MAENSADKTATLGEFVEAGVNDDLTYYNLSIKGEIMDLQIIDHCLIDDYKKELKAISDPVNGLTRAEINKFRYSPDFLSYYLYGTTQWDFILLLVNGISSPEEFTMEGTIYAPKASLLRTFLSEVMSAEQEYIQLNNIEYNLV